MSFVPLRERDPKRRKNLFVLMKGNEARLSLNLRSSLIAGGLLLGILGGSALTYHACKKSPCAGVICLNGYCDPATGQCVCIQGYYGDHCQVRCVHGTGSNSGCVCDPGYRGPACDTPVNARLSGIYRLEDRCPGDTVTFEYSQFLPDQEDPRGITIVHFAGWLCNRRPVSVTMELRPDGQVLVLSPDTQRFCNNRLVISFGQGIIRDAGRQVEIQYVYTDSSLAFPKTEMCFTVYERL